MTLIPIISGVRERESRVKLGKKRWPQTVASEENIARAGRGGARKHVSAWFPCGRNPLTWTDKDLINTRLCNYSIIKVICPLVWMSRQDATCAPVGADKRKRAWEAQRGRLLMFEFNAWFSKPIFPSHVLIKYLFRLLLSLVFICLLFDNSFVIHWESNKLSRLSTKYHQEPHEIVNRPDIIVILFKLHCVRLELCNGTPAKLAESKGGSNTRKNVIFVCRDQIAWKQSESPVWGVWPWARIKKGDLKVTAKCQRHVGKWQKKNKKTAGVNSD